jgi:exosortase D (VPLPA-CTERM-specific)
MIRKNIIKHKLWDEAWFKACILFGLFIAAYWIPLKTIVNVWWTDEDYSYGFLIPLFSAYLLWEKRKVLRNIQFRTVWPALPFLIFFVLLSLYGILGSSGNISMPAIPILIILFTAFCFGMETIRRLIMPLGFLIFMIRIPPSIEGSLGLYLKQISSKLGGAIIALFNISVNVSGNIIDLGVTQLQVVDACSGMRYLFPLMALGVVYAYFFEKVIWKRVFCVLATIPIAVLTNTLRIGITGILTNYYGPKMAEGFFHNFSGWILFMVALACLFLLGRILAFFPPEKSAIQLSDISEVNMQTESISSANTNLAFIISAGLLVLVLIFSLSTKALPPVKIQGGIASFPLEFAGWQGRSEYVNPEIIIQSGAEESFNGIYRNDSGDVISLYMGYRSTAFLSNDNFFHSPTVCIPSAGWITRETSIHVIKGVPFFGDMKVIEMLIEKGWDKQLVYFWFQTKDKVTNNKDINRFHLAMHAIKRDNTYDLFIRPITPLQRNEPIGNAETRMDNFVRQMMGTMLGFLKERQIKNHT